VSTGMSPRLRPPAASQPLSGCSGSRPSGLPGWAPLPSCSLLQLRIYSNMLQEPQDAIDPQVCDAADDFMGRVSGGFTLNGLVRDVDLLGEYRHGA
jgi:hypothetical protein